MDFQHQPHTNDTSVWRPLGLIVLFDGMGSYAGTYTIEGDKVSHHVDISWIESWTGVQ